ncbi:MAG: alpha/beta fold hydrolase [Phycisphaerae bacterium]
MTAVSVRQQLGNLYPFSSHFHDLGGVKMHYVDEGEGSPLVMVHGNPTWSFYFRELITAFRDQHRVIAVDHVGCGMSDKPQSYPYTLRQHTENLTSLLDHLGVDDVTLVVHDWGGAIGFGWAARNTERVRQSVVFNTAAWLGTPGPLRIWLSGLPLVGEVSIRGLNGFARAALFMAVGSGKRLPRDVARGLLAPYRSYADRVAHLAFVRDIPYGPRVPSHAELAETESLLPGLADKPMLICWGGQDFCFNDAFLAEWKARFPQADVHRFADAGHYVVEDACDRIVPLMRDFLANA